MRVHKACLTPYEIPLRGSMSTASERIRTRRGFVVRLQTEKGWGLGDMSPHPAITLPAWQLFQESAQSTAAQICGSSFTNLPDMDWSGVNPGVAMGLDMALHDAAARAADRSLAAYLGAKSVAAISSSVLLQGDSLLESAQRAFASGYRVAKMKAHIDPQRTLLEIRSIRSALPNLGLRLDVNEAWSRETAVSFCRELPRNFLQWIEQPVSRADLAGMRAVRETGVSVAADESVRDVSDVTRLAVERAADVIVIKLMQVGGLAAAVRVAAEAAVHDLRVCLTTGLDSSIATAAVLHLSGALRPQTASGFATLSLLQGDLVSESLREGPTMTWPKGYGLGVELDETSPFLRQAVIYESA